MSEPRNCGYTIELAENPLPFFCSSPHSGRFYTAEFKTSCTLNTQLLNLLQDGPVDLLLEGLPHLGLSVIKSYYSRAIVDFNRSKLELAPEIAKSAGRGFRYTQKTQVGLGVIPTRISGQAIFHQPPSMRELSFRLDQVHESYHAQITRLSRSLITRFGEALLLDCHSMPDDVAYYNQQQVDVVLGDNHGRAASAHYMNLVRSVFEDAGYKVACNNPYAGGYITVHHGKPVTGLGVIQIELRRGLFMRKHDLKPDYSFQVLRQVFATLAQKLADDFSKRQFRQKAAE